MEIQDAQRIHHRLGTRGGLEVKCRQLVREAPRAEGCERVQCGVGVRRGLPLGDRTLGHNHLGGIDRVQNGEEILDVLASRQPEFAARQVELTS